MSPRQESEGSILERGETQSVEVGGQIFFFSDLKIDFHR